MSPNAKLVRALIDTVERELKKAVGNGSIEKELCRQRKNIVSAVIYQVLIKFIMALG